MNKYRWLILFANLLLILAIVGLGFYFFFGLGFWMQRAVGIDEKYAPEHYFKAAPIPNWDANQYKPRKKTEARRRTMEKDYAYVGRAYTPEMDTSTEEKETEAKPPEAQVLLNARVKQVLSVVYSASSPKMNGCYLQTPVAGVGDRVYFYCVGDTLPDLGDDVQFTIERIDEIERGKKYSVVFKDGQSREASKEFVRSEPAAYSIESQIEKGKEKKRKKK